MSKADIGRQFEGIEAKIALLREVTRLRNQLATAEKLLRAQYDNPCDPAINAEVEKYLGIGLPENLTEK